MKLLNTLQTLLTSSPATLFPYKVSPDGVITRRSRLFNSIRLVMTALLGSIQTMVALNGREVTPTFTV